MNPTLATVKELALRGLSHPEVADEMRHLRPDTVRVYYQRIVAGLGVEERRQLEQARTSRGSPGKGNYHRRFSERSAISPEHIRIGRKLLAKRLQDGSNLTDFARCYGLSNRVTLSAMEQGYHDFTMSEIKIIADAVDTTIEDLMCPPPEVLVA